MGSETKLQQMIRWFQDHRVFSWVLFGMVVLIGLGMVTGAIENIVSFSNKYLAFRHKQVIQVMPEEIIPIPKTGFGYHYFPAAEGFGLGNPDTLDRNHESRLILLEDGKPLGPAHSGHKEIEDAGAGRFSHWRDDWNREYLYFSTSDNSNPQTNRRAYAVGTPDRGGPPLALDSSKIVKVLDKGAQSFGYRYRGPGLDLSPADSQRQPGISRLVVLENGKPLGPAHSPAQDVADMGKGRYSHWHDGQAEWLFFSTSDNTDPRKNGRVYAITTQ